jgi:hypothetical protein
MPQRLQRFGIKSDGIINFLSNEPPIELMQRLRYRGACPAEAHWQARGINSFIDVDDVDTGENINENLRSS